MPAVGTDGLTHPHPLRRPRHLLMQSPTHDTRAAMALATASVIGDKRAAERHMCSVRSLQRWRANCETDDTLAAAVALKRSELIDAWADELPEAILAAVDFLRRAATDADTRCPDAIHAVAGAMKLLSDTATMQRALDARCPRPSKSDGAAAGQVAASALN